MSIEVCMKDRDEVTEIFDIIVSLIRYAGSGLRVALFCLTISIEISAFSRDYPNPRHYFPVDHSLSRQYTCNTFSETKIPSSWIYGR